MEAIPLLIQAFIELLFLMIQLTGVVVEILCHVICFLIHWLTTSVRKKQATAPDTLEKTVQTAWDKRFGGKPTAETNNKVPALFQWNRWHTGALVIWLGLIAGIAVTVFCLWGRRFDIVVTQQEVQQAVNSRLPISKSILKAAEVKLENPVVTLDDNDNCIHADIDCRLHIQGVPFDMKGTLKLAGRLEYQAHQGAFYLHELHIEKLDLKGIPGHWEDKARDGIAKVAREALKTFPVYRLKDGKPRDQAARLVLKEVRVEQGKLILTMSIGG